MGSDLNAGLGTGRDPRPPRRGPFGPRQGLIALALVAVLGVSAYSALAPDNLKPAEEAAKVTETADQTTAGTDKRPADSGEKAKVTAVDDRNRPLDAANVETVTLEDGTVVNKFTPKKRDKDGPVIIDATANEGQDVRVAALPNPDLIEDTPDGPLPVIGPDGTRPMDQYGRPWSGARGTRIAIVIGGLGLSQTGTQRALKGLPEEVTLAFAVSGNSLQRWMQEARRNGHEVLLQLALEPFDYPANDPGPLTLLTENAPGDNLDLLHRSLGKITNYSGVMNYLGGKFMSDANAFEPVMRDLSGRGLLFLDDGSQQQTLTPTLAKAFGMPAAFADVQIDGQLDRAAILGKLDELERIANRKGYAIGTGSAFDETVAAVNEWYQEATRRGIEIVGVSALAEIPN